MAQYGRRLDKELANFPKLVSKMFKVITLECFDIVKDRSLDFLIRPAELNDATHFKAEFKSCF